MNGRVLRQKRGRRCASVIRIDTVELALGQPGTTSRLVRSPERLEFFDHTEEPVHALSVKNWPGQGQVKGGKRTPQARESDRTTNACRVQVSKVCSQSKSPPLPAGFFLKGHTNWLAAQLFRPVGPNGVG